MPLPLISLNPLTLLLEESPIVHKVGHTLRRGNPVGTHEDGGGVADGEESVVATSRSALQSFLQGIESNDQDTREKAIDDLHDYWMGGVDKNSIANSIAKNNGISIMVKAFPTESTPLSGVATYKLLHVFQGMLQDDKFRWMTPWDWDDFVWGESGEYSESLHSTNEYYLDIALQSNFGPNMFAFKIYNWCSYYFRMDLVRDDYDAICMRGAKECATGFGLALELEYPWFFFYEAIARMDCLYILEGIRQGSASSTPYERFFYVVGKNGDLYGKLYDFFFKQHGPYGQPYWIHGQEYWKRSSCLQMVKEENIMEVGKDLMKSMDMLAVASTSDFHPSTDAARALLTLIKTDVGYVLYDLTSKNKWIQWIPFIVSDGRANGRARALALQWTEWYTSAKMRLRQLATMLSNNKGGSETEKEDEDVFTEDEKYAISQLTKYQDMSVTLIEYYAQRNDAGSEDIIEAAKTIIEQINNPFKPGSTNDDKPDSLMFRESKRAFWNDPLLGGDPKKQRSEGAIRNSILNLFGPKHVESMWKGSSRAPGLEHFCVGV